MSPLTFRVAPATIAFLLALAAVGCKPAEEAAPLTDSAALRLSRTPPSTPLPNKAPGFSTDAMTSTTGAVADSSGGQRRDSTRARRDTTRRPPATGGDTTRRSAPGNDR